MATIRIDRNQIAFESYDGPQDGNEQSNRDDSAGEWKLATARAIELKGFAARVEIHFGNDPSDLRGWIDEDDDFADIALSDEELDALIASADEAGMNAAADAEARRQKDAAEFDAVEGEAK